MDLKTLRPPAPIPPTAGAGPDQAPSITENAYGKQPAPLGASALAARAPVPAPVPLQTPAAAPSSVPYEEEVYACASDAMREIVSFLFLCAGQFI